MTTNGKSGLLHKFRSLEISQVFVRAFDFKTEPSGKVQSIADRAADTVVINPFNQ